MFYVVSPEEMRQLDMHMMREQGVPGVVLMEHAALGVAEVVCAVLQEYGKKCGRHGGRPGGAGASVGILCGGGNNGGDGLAVLRQLHMRGIFAWAALLNPPESLAGDALLQYHMVVNMGLPIYEVLTEQAVEALPIHEAAVLVDALFGTGLTRDIVGRYRVAVRCMNMAKAPIVAVDIPSGVDGATGGICGEAVQAALTVTFQHKKLGHLLLPGRMHTGRLHVVPIGLPSLSVYTAEHWEMEDVQNCLPARSMDSHKGKNGRALLCAGSGRYAGAAIMCANAALRGGCGLLSVVVPAGLHSVVRAGCPAAISSPVGAAGEEWSLELAEEAAGLLQGKHAVAIGPGMGQGPGVRLLLERALLEGLPLVIDADGLNALAKNKELFSLLHKNVVLTPHIGEMARLWREGINKIETAPLQYAKDAAEKWGCTMLLKGATSIIAGSGRICLNTEGNTGLAKGGSGDVLTGILLALLAQGLPAYEAACASAYLLGASAEEAYRLLGTRMLMPTDVIEALGKVYE